MALTKQHSMYVGCGSSARFLQSRIFTALNGKETRGQLNTQRTRSQFQQKTAPFLFPPQIRNENETLAPIPIWYPFDAETERERERERERDETKKGEDDTGEQRKKGETEWKGEKETNQKNRGDQIRREQLEKKGKKGED